MSKDLLAPLRSALILLYSVANLILAPLLWLLPRFSEKLKAQLSGRKSVAELSAEVAKPRSLKRRAAVFFCSSAGEYEQARPLIERLQAQSDVFVHVIFFSRSGYEFAKARGETMSFSLSPAIDSVWHWGRIFSALRPDIIVVVRHELWPGFLETARHFGKVYLIDASQSLGETASGLKRFMRGQLLRFFDRIFVVTDADAKFFRETYDLKSVVVAGDTKYDRVLERARERQGDAAKLAMQLGGNNARRLVLGSAHKPDVELWLKAWEKLGAATADWQVVVASHHVDKDMLAWVQAQCSAIGLESKLYGDMAAETSAARPAPRVVVVDRMGLLAEIYGTATLAFVGGAVHHQVHNVLEPACRGLALAFGPLYKNSQEAAHLVTEGLADVCGDSDAFAAWWRRHQQGDGDYRRRLTDEVARLCGASERIMAEWAVQRQTGADRVGGDAGQATHH